MEKNINRQGLLQKILKLLISDGKIMPSDNLSIKTVRANKVYCVYCHSHIFYIKDDSRGAVLDNLVPLAGARDPTDYSCPICNHSSVVRNPAVTLLTDRGYIA